MSESEGSGDAGVAMGSGTLLAMWDRLPGMAYRCLNEPDWPMEYVSGGCRELTGHEPATLIGRAGVEYGSLIVEEDAGRVWNTVQAAIAEGQAFKLQYRITTADGGEKWVWEQGQAVVDDTGEVIALEGFITDVGDARRTRDELEDQVTWRTRDLEAANEAIAASEARFRAVLGSITEAIFVVTADQQVIYANPASLELLSMSEERCHGQQLGTLLTELGCESQQWVDRLQRAFTRGQASREEGTLGGAPKPRHFESLVFPIRDGSGEPFLVGLSLRDISWRMRAERKLRRQKEELERSNGELTQFAHMTSHDLKGPLQIIGGYAELLAATSGDRLEATGLKYLQAISDGADRMHHLIDDILTYAEAGQRAPHPVEVDTAEVLHDALKDLGIEGGDKGGPIRASELPRVHADSVSLRRLFQNLIGNALKYHSDQPPLVRVSAEREATAWVFSVADNGLGIAPRHFERVFQAFERVETDRTRGTGIGLATCKKIVERHGGRIWVESDEGAGATFHFTLPDPRTDADETAAS